MAVSLNDRGHVRGSVAGGPSYTLTLTLGAGTNRKAIVFVGLEDLTITVSGVTFDGNAMSAVGGAGSPARINDVLGQLFIYDISDGMSTGSKNIVATLSDGENTEVIGWIINGAATGALEDVQSDTAAGGTTLSATLTNASTSYVGAGIVNGATTPTWTWSNLTEWLDDAGGTTQATAADATSLENATASAEATNTSNDKVLIAWAVAEAAASGVTHALHGSPRGLVRGIMRGTS